MPNPLIDTSKQENLIDRDKRKNDREKSDVRFQLKSPEGRRLYWSDLESCGIFRPTIAFDSDGKHDPYMTAFNEGRRSVGLEKLKVLLEAKPEAFYQMQQEHASEQVSEKNLDKIDQKTSD